MKKLTIIGILLSLLVLAGCGGNITGDSTNDNTIKIGVVTPLTGDVSNFGEWTHQGLDLALEEINSQGGIDNKQLELIYEDSKCLPKEASTAIQKLINIDKVSVVIGDICSSATLSMAPIAEENKVVLISTASSSPKITDAGDYIFRNWPSDTFEAGAMAGFANKKGYSTASILYVNNDYGIGLRDIFGNKFDGEIASVESYEQESADFRTQLTKIKASEPDAIFVGGYTNEIGRVLKQAQELGIKAQFLSVSPAESPKMLEIAGDAAEGLYYSYFALDETEESIRSYQKKFKAKYGQESEIFAATAYDALNIIKLAMQYGTDSETVKSTLYSVKDYPGVSGITTFDSNGDVAKPAVIKTINDGEFIKAEEQ